jgi:hypothetical protein
MWWHTIVIQATPEAEGGWSQAEAGKKYELGA